MKKKPSFVRVYKGIQIPWLLVVASLICAIISSYVELNSVTLTAQIIDSSQNIKREKIVSFVLFILESGALGVISTFLSSYVSQKLNLGVRSKLWNKMLRIPVRYYDGESGESLVSRVTTDCDKASSYISYFINLITAIYAAVIAVIRMFKIDPVLSKYALLIIPFSTVIGYLLGKLYYRVGNKRRGVFANTMLYLLEHVRNFRLIRTAGMEDKEKETGKKCFHTQYKADRSYATIEALQTGTSTILSVFLTVLILIIGRNKIAEGEMSTGNVLAFYTISAMVLARFSQIIAFYNSITETNGTLAKICAVFEYDEEVTDGLPLDIPNRDIQVKDVHFAYTDKPVLDGVTCVIPKNKITAIIGANGTGKSTLFKLLERIYEPDEGEICFGEESVNRFSLTAWRKAFAIVAQDRPLMQGTIRENITYGCERDITETELEEVACKANILDLVSSLPDGFDTQVGPNGSNFSGGQRQCIAIARAIMRNPDYLLLDEATSNLDAKNESMVTSALQNLMIGRTTLIIAHNLSAIRHADNVIVMQNGKVTACGTPQDVIKSSDAYRDFATCQTR